MGDSGSIRSHRDLIAWQRSFEFALRLYEVIESFPARERFALTDQLRRGAVSLASDISEGYGRGTTRDYLRFLRMARGSMYEIDTQLLFAKRLGYVDANIHTELERDLGECGRALAGLIRSVAKNPRHSRTEPSP